MTKKQANRFGSFAGRKVCAGNRDLRDATVQRLWRLRGAGVSAGWLFYSGFFSARGGRSGRSLFASALAGPASLVLAEFRNLAGPASLPFGSTCGVSNGFGSGVAL